MGAIWAVGWGREMEGASTIAYKKLEGTCTEVRVCVHAQDFRGLQSSRDESCYFLQCGE